jgi:hypothetical protein
VVGGSGGDDSRRAGRTPGGRIEEDGHVQVVRRHQHRARWLRDAVVANRVAFEYEMRRERRRLLDSRFETFWKEMSARQA